MAVLKNHRKKTGFTFIELLPEIGFLSLLPGAAALYRWPEMRGKRATMKSCKDDEIIARGTRLAEAERRRKRGTSAAPGYGPQHIPSFFPSGLARQRRAGPEGKKEARARWVKPCCAAGAFLALWLMTAEVHAQDFTYTTNNGSLAITSYTGPGGAVSIPGMIFGLPVTSLGDWAFFDSNTVASVVIPDSVTNIGDWTFGACAGLTNVHIGNGVKSIGFAAFTGCATLTHITIPDSVTDLRDGFYSIGGVGVFYRCSNLSSVTLGNSLTNIGDSAFWFCTSLTNITLPESVLRVGAHAFESCSSLRSISMGTRVTTLDADSFANCPSLTNVTIPSGVTNIGAGAFADGSLRGAYFAGNAPGGGVDAFLSANALTVYYLPGTTGWGPTFADKPTVLWNPLAQTMDASFGVRQGRFGFNINGTADIPLVIEASPSLLAGPWVSLQTCTLTNGLIYFSDPQWTNYPRRFYRIRSP